jgi:HK97 family phage portal protein
MELRLGSFALTDMVQWGYNGLRNIKANTGEQQARGIPALSRAAQLRATEIAKLDLCCYRGKGPEKEKVESVWQARLFSNGPQATATNPVQSKFTFWETAEESLAWRGNAFIWKNFAAGRVTSWYALHPDQVKPHYDNSAKKVVYDITVAEGYVDPVGAGPKLYKNLDEHTILHIRGHGQGGMLMAPSPFEVNRDVISAAISRQRHENRMWRRGTALQVAIEFPPGVSKESADQWREVWRSNFEGTEGETTAVIGNGGQIKPIGMTAVDSNFVEMANLTVQDSSRIMGVPANLLGVQTGKVRANIEDDLMVWLRFGLSGELARIEEALYADPDLFGGSQTYPEFDTTKFVRGDLATEAAIQQGDVQAGISTPDEIRHERGLPPHPGGVGAIPQITPVGGAPNAIMKLKPPIKPAEPVGVEE